MTGAPTSAPETAFWVDAHRGEAQGRPITVRMPDRSLHFLTDLEAGRLRDALTRAVSGSQEGRAAQPPTPYDRGMGGAPEPSRRRRLL